MRLRGIYNASLATIGMMHVHLQGTPGVVPCRKGVPGVEITKTRWLSDEARC
jgi:hypothetical protein